MYRAHVTVTLRKSILDPQGKAVHHALESLGLNAVEDVRIGKYLELTVRGGNETEVRALVEEACKKLLANPVMEDYAFTLEKIS